MTDSAHERSGDTVAAVDVGSNTIKMTVARWDGSSLIEVSSIASTVRLSAGIEQTGTINAAREAAALACLTQFAADAKDAGATVFVGVATEVLRVAANGADVLARVKAETPWRLAVISGADEAALTYEGVRTALDHVSTAVIADIGGGSTELIAVADGQPTGFISVPIGSGRLTDRLVQADPPSGEEFDRCREAVADAVDGLPLMVPTPLQLLLITGGTGLYLGVLVGGEARFPVEKLTMARETLIRFPSAIVSDFLKIPLERARVLPAGVAAVTCLAQRWNPAQIGVSESGVRRGVLMRYFHGEDLT